MLELIEKTLKNGEFVPLECTRSVFESAAVMPENFPDIEKILTVTSAVKAIDLQDGGQTPGIKLEHTILYTTQNSVEPIASYTFLSEHTLGLNIPGTINQPQLIMNAFVEHTDFTMDDNRKITLRCVVRGEPRLFYNTETSLVTDVEGVEGIQLKQNSLPISELQLLPEAVCEIKEEFVLPAGKKAVGKILQTDHQISDITVAIEDGLAIVKGIFSTCTLYLEEDGGQTPGLWENRLPFTCNLLLPSLDASLIFKSCTVKDFTLDVKTDEDGENRILLLSALISATAICCQPQEIKVVTDAFALDRKLNFTLAPVRTSRAVCGVDSQFVLKDIVQKPEDAPTIAEVISVSGVLGHSELQILDGKISMEGLVSCKVLYLSTDQGHPVSAFNIEIPFCQTFDEPHAEKGLLGSLDGKIVHVSFCVISPEEIELRLALSVSGTITKTEEFSVVSELSQGENLDTSLLNRPSILIYIVQPGDTLWEIAKHYGTSPASLQNLNDLKNPDFLSPGQKLIIA